MGWDGMSMDVETRVGQILALYSGPDTDVARLLCDRHPDEDVALVVVAQDLSATTVTYGELAESSRRFAAVLRSRGVRPGERVATLMGKGADLVTVILGIWRAGAVYVPLFTAFAEGTIAARLQGAAARVLVADREQLFKVPDGSWQVLVSGGAPGAPGVDSLDHALAHAPVDPRESVAVGGDGPLVHMFTSGTTSAPKGVVHPVRYAAGWHSYLEFGLGIGEDSVFWCGADPGWAYGLYTAIVAPLAAGIPTILAVGGFTAEATWAVLEKLGVTDYAAAPTVYRSLLAADHLRPANLTLRRLSSAGEPLTPEVNEWASTALGLLVHDHFGQTELGMPIGFPHHPDLEVPVVAGAMGVALPGWTMTVLRDDAPAEMGETGRLAVVVGQSPLMTFTGYAGDRGDSDKFVTGGAYFVTGDLASIDASGVLRFSSRDDDVIIMAGYRIGPFDVESVLLQHPSVAECAVIAAPDPMRGEVIEAFVVPAGDVCTDDRLINELQQWVKTRYAAHAYPRRIHFVDRLPKTASGKIQRAQLRRQRQAGATPAGTS